MKIVIGFLLMLLSSIHLYGKLNDYTRFNYLASPNYELRSNAITSIEQDSVGIIWVGTRNGLFKYNGNEYKEAKSINDYLKAKFKQDIFSLHFDKRGWLWIGSLNGLSLYNPKTKEIHELEDIVSGDLIVNDISSTKTGDVIIAIHKKLFAYISSKKQFVDITPGIKKNKIAIRYYHVCQTTNGNVWVSTSIGLCKLSDKEDGYKLQEFYDYDDLGAKKIVKLKRIKLLEDAKGNLLLGAFNGLFKFNSNSCSLQPYFDKLNSNSITSIRDFVIDNKNRLWIGTMNGIHIYDYKNLKTISYNPQNISGLSDDRIRTLLVDKNNTVWVGTYFGGVNYWNDRNIQFYHLSDKTKRGLTDKTVKYIAEDSKGIIYFGTEKKGVTVYNPKTGSYYNLHKNKAFVPSPVVYILPDENDLWLGTVKHGMVRFNMQTNETKIYKPKFEYTSSFADRRVLSIVKQSDTLFLVSIKFKGLYSFNPKMGIYKQITQKGKLKTPSIIYSLIKDHSGNLWLSSQHQLMMIRNDSLKNGSYYFEEVLSGVKGSIIINDLYVDEDGTVWIAGANGLLYKNNKKGLIKIDVPKEISFFSIAPGNKKNLWLSSGDGVVQFNKETNRYKIFDSKHGLQINPFSDGCKLKSGDGNIYFGGTSGVTCFNPATFSQEIADTSSVLITDFLVYNKSVTVGDNTGILKESIEYTNELKLHHTQNMFAIKFAYGDFGFTTRYNFEYRLKGFNNEWIRTNVPQVAYTLQTGGEYVFEVRYLNSNGEIASDIKTLKIILEKPFWKTTWAYLIYVGFLFIVLGIFLYQYKSKMELNFQLNMELGDIERQKQVHQQKLNFFTNVSHDFRTPLTLIVGAVDQFVTKYHLSHEMYKILKSVQKNIDQLQNLVNDLLDFQKIEEKQLQLQVTENNITDFVKEVFLSFKVKAEVNKINYTFNSEEIKQTIYLDSLKMERVIYNLLSNAFKFTDEGGEISVNINDNENEVFITINDTGCGISEENMKFVFDRFYENNNEGRKELLGTGIGLSVSKSIVELHKGNIEFTSKENEGSTFTITLLKGNTHYKSKDLRKGEVEGKGLKYLHWDEGTKQYEKINSIVEEIWRGNKMDHSVLIAEDNEELRMYLKEALSEYFNVAVAEDGQAAFKSVINSPPNLIISDVMMPKMDGIEFCKKIKMTTETSHIPFVMLTARTSLINKYEGLESGADEYINKPFYLKELVLKCINILRTQKSLRERFMSAEYLLKESFEDSDPDKELYEKTMAILNENVANEYFGVQDLCMEIGLSRSVLYTKVKGWTDQSPGELLLGFRMKHAAKLLEKRKYSISQIANMVGYKRANYFSKCFKNYHELSPSEYLKKHC